MDDSFWSRSWFLTFLLGWERVSCLFLFFFLSRKRISFLFFLNLTYLLGRKRVFFLLYFLNFFYKIPPQDICYREASISNEEETIIHRFAGATRVRENFCRCEQCCRFRGSFSKCSIRSFSACIPNIYKVTHTYILHTHIFIHTYIHTYVHYIHNIHTYIYSGQIFLCA